MGEDEVDFMVYWVDGIVLGVEFLVMCVFV